jgi:hypothetical protein
MASGCARLKLIVGGVQKAGTTSLFGYLAQHPQLLPPPRKELHFFDNERLDWNLPDYGPLERAFVDEPERLAFESTPISLFWPNALERIFAYNPDIKLIFIFRDPIERAWSHWRMETARGIETLPFGVAIREGRERLTSESVPDHAWRHFSYVERGYYAAQLRRALALFPRENMLLLRAADLRHYHMATLSAIAVFLGIEPFPELQVRLDRQGEPSAPMSAVDSAYLSALFRDELAAFSSMSGLLVDDWPTMQTLTEGVA